MPKDVLTPAPTTNVGNSIKVITDEPTKDAPDFKKYTDQLSNLIINSKPQFTVGIYGGWGTGKTTIMQMIKDEIDKIHSDNVATTWFDAWRYEKEQYSAMVPLLRTISLSLKNSIENSRDGKKKSILTRLEDHVSKLGSAIPRHTNVNLAANVGAGSGGAQFDIGKIIDDYKSDGSFIHGQERIYYHKHITDHLQEEFNKIRNIEKHDFRLVIFVDDLDRCTPERALELLESIKTFFDIEGIIYVVGIDPTTIDSLIQTKYGKESKIDGMDYLQKIVQIPFQVPVWSPVDLSKTIGAMIERAGMNVSEFEPILKQTSTELIINAARLNPRDIKRFVNSIILATYMNMISKILKN
jgi:predicted KAP-like P-loop ATPase